MARVWKEWKNWIRTALKRSWRKGNGYLKAKGVDWSGKLRILSVWVLSEKKTWSRNTVVETKRGKKHTWVFIWRVEQYGSRSYQAKNQRKKLKVNYLKYDLIYLKF